MSDISMRERPRRVTGWALRRFQDGAVVSGGHASDMVAMNPTALALWELCDGATTVGEMVDAVYDLFGISPDQARRDVEAAVVQMRNAGVVT